MASVLIAVHYVAAIRYQMHNNARRIIPDITPDLFERLDSVEGTWVSETCTTFGGTLSPESANMNTVRCDVGILFGNN
jgi:hypothetical protein